MGVIILLFYIFCFADNVIAEDQFFIYVDPKGTVHVTNMPEVFDSYIEGKNFTNEESLYSSYKKPAAGKKSRVTKSGYESHIKKASKRYNISESLISAIIKVESNFKPTAVSKKGALGLMQLMPETAAELGVIDPFDPVENIHGGVRYLRQLLDYFKGDLELALAAYNAGAGMVKKYNSIPPFKETKNYVAKVLNIYHRTSNTLTN